MKIVITLHHLGGSDKKKKSVHVQYTCNRRRPNYIVHVSNKVIFFPKYFQSVGGWSTNVEPTDLEGRLFQQWGGRAGERDTRCLVWRRDCQAIMQDFTISQTGCPAVSLPLPLFSL